MNVLRSAAMALPLTLATCFISTPSFAQSTPITHFVSSDGIFCGSPSYMDVLYRINLRPAAPGHATVAFEVPVDSVIWQPVPGGTIDATFLEGELGEGYQLIFDAPGFSLILRDPAPGIASSHERLAIDSVHGSVGSPGVDLGNGLECYFKH